MYGLKEINVKSKTLNSTFIVDEIDIDTKRPIIDNSAKSNRIEMEDYRGNMLSNRSNEFDSQRVNRQFLKDGKFCIVEKSLQIKQRYITPLAKRDQPDKRAWTDPGKQNDTPFIQRTHLIPKIIVSDFSDSEAKTENKLEPDIKSLSLDHDKEQSSIPVENEFNKINRINQMKLKFQHENMMNSQLLKNLEKEKMAKLANLDNYFNKTNNEQSKENTKTPVKIDQMQINNKNFTSNELKANFNMNKRSKIKIKTLPCESKCKCCDKSVIKYNEEKLFVSNSKNANINIDEFGQSVIEQDSIFINNYKNDHEEDNSDANFDFNNNQESFENKNFYLNQMNDEDEGHDNDYYFIRPENIMKNTVVQKIDEVDQKLESTETLDSTFNAHQSIPELATTKTLITKVTLTKPAVVPISIEEPFLYLYVDSSKYSEIFNKRLIDLEPMIINDELKSAITLLTVSPENDDLTILNELYDKNVPIERKKVQCYIRFHKEVFSNHAEHLIKVNEKKFLFKRAIILKGNFPKHEYRHNFNQKGNF